ncbi:MAG: serine hydrolase [Alphaproteobacteria bacterium]|nr:serine hydrolase [Alphaproteobacteria bacterium]
MGVVARIVWAFAALLLAACGNPVAKNADALMDDLDTQGVFTGAVVIAKKGEIVYERGFGMADASRRFSPDTNAEAGSLAKTVTATAVLLLESEGDIDLDAAANTYVAEFPYPEVTVRHLLSHSAGLPDYDAFEDLIESAAPTDNISLLKAAGERQPATAFAPGSEFDYCNLCYDALAAIVEHVSGQSFIDFIAARFFLPAGMTDTYIRPAKFVDWPGPRALGYKLRGDKIELNDVFDNEGFYGGANINFTSRDLARWMMLWAENHAAIPPSVRKAAVQPAIINDAASGISLGSWYFGGDGAHCYYTGHNQGFHAFAYWDSREEIAIAFISNNTMIAPIQPALARSLIAIAEGCKPQRLVVDTQDEAGEADIAAVAGAYKADAGRSFSILNESGRAFLVFSEAPRLLLYPVGFHILYAPGADIYLLFDPSNEAVVVSSVFDEWQAYRR